MVIDDTSFWFFGAVSDEKLQWRHNECDGVSNHRCLDYPNVCSGVDQRKHQSSASLTFVRKIHRWILLRRRNLCVCVWESSINHKCRQAYMHQIICRYKLKFLEISIVSTMGGPVYSLSHIDDRDTAQFGMSALTPFVLMKDIAVFVFGVNGVTQWQIRNRVVLL